MVHDLHNNGAFSCTCAVPLKIEKHTSLALFIEVSRQVHTLTTMCEVHSLLDGKELNLFCLVGVQVSHPWRNTQVTGQRTDYSLLVSKVIVQRRIHATQ